MLRFVLIFSTFCMTQLAFSQKYIGLSFGGQYIERQDLVLSPSIYKGVAPLNMQLLYRYNTPRTIKEISIHAGMFSLSANPAFNYIEPEESKTVKTNPSKMLLIEARYTYLRRFSDKNPFNWAIGGVLDNQIIGHFQEYGYGSAFGYTTVSALSIAGQVHTAVGQKGQLSLRMFTPIVSWVGRSPFALNDDAFIENLKSHRTLKMIGYFIADGSVQLPNVFQKINGQIIFTHKLSHRFQLNLSDEIEIVRTKQPRPLNNWRNQLAVGLAFQL
jgi:hypothetical protein